MEMEYQDPSRRGRWIVVAGVALALVAGGAAFFLINSAQQQAGSAGLQKVSVVVAARPIAARKPIEAEDVVVREVPLDKTNEQGTIATKDEVMGRILAVSVLEGQLVTTNLLASTAKGGQFSILEPGEIVAAESEAWRAVSLTVGDAQAVGGVIEAGQTVDVFVTATVNVPQELLDAGKYYTDRSTKITYQNMLILARTAGTYVVKVPLRVAEEIVHLQASGTASFSMALRPDADTRLADATRLGATTNLLITRYGLPIPEVYPAGGGGVPVQPPAFPSAAPTPAATPAPSTAPEPSPSP